MSTRLRERLTHMLLTALLTAGLLLPLLKILEPSFVSAAPLIWAAVIILLFELACTSRI